MKPLTYFLSNSSKSLENEVINNSSVPQNYEELSEIKGKEAPNLRVNGKVNNAANSCDNAVDLDENLVPKDNNISVKEINGKRKSLRLKKQKHFDYAVKDDLDDLVEGATVKGNDEFEEGTDNAEIGTKNKSKKRGRKRKVKTETKETNTTSDLQSNKLNAFQFMMESRHKVIGRNSPGKEIRVEITLETTVKEKKERKATINKHLEDWAEEKGASKRKREYEEKTACVNQKLETRARKLKEMLQITEENDGKEINSRPKRKRVNVIASDTDESQDSVIISNSNSQEKLVENSVDNEASSNEVTKNRSKKRRSKANGKLSLNSKRKFHNEIEDKACNSDDSPAIEKHWKMKIKLNLKSSGDDNSGGADTKQEKKLVLRNRQPKETNGVDSLLDGNNPSKANKKPPKIAPVFAKSVPKTKLNPETIEARRKFLLSGVPESLKKELCKQQSVDEVEFDVFPTISHVQQKVASEALWNLPEVDLNLITEEPFKLKCNMQIMCRSLTNIQIHDALRNNFVPKPPIRSYKKIIHEIKNNNPNYPVYKTFKFIYENSGYKPIIKDLKPKKSDEEIIAMQQNSMWTEKYKPKTSNDILGNYNSISSLKKFLKTWLEFGGNRRKRANSSSESELDFTDCGDSVKLPSNTIVLTGPTGCGKSTAIYAICNELGFNVLELNASSKRTGKRLIQELQEATQSHQVRKSDNPVMSFMNKTKQNNELLSASQMMCVLLVEDVDLVFDQDEGFISALTQLMTTSKRPIILTTTDTSSLLIQKFLLQNQTIQFSPLSAKILSIWLQIVCLVEGIYVDQQTLGELLQYNRGDVRRTLLQLQIWVTTGGQLNNERNRLTNKSNFPTASSTNDEFSIDDSSTLSSLIDDENEGNCLMIHYNCIRSFEVFRQFNIPDRLNLDLVWWNLPNILTIPNYSSLRLEKMLPQNTRLTKNEVSSYLKSKEKKKLRLFSKFYDSLALVDFMSRKLNSNSKLKDSLELEERKDSSDSDDLGFINDLGHCLITGCIKEYKIIEDSVVSSINMAVPMEIEERWRRKLDTCDNTFRTGLTLSSHLERTSIAVDYMPSLRNIARSELKRSINNTKRGNRFYNYLNNLGINCRDSMCKSACNILTITDYD